MCAALGYDGVREKNFELQWKKFSGKGWGLD